MTCAPVGGCVLDEGGRKLRLWSAGYGGSHSEVSRADVTALNHTTVGVRGPTHSGDLAERKIRTVNCVQPYLVTPPILRFVAPGARAWARGPGCGLPVLCCVLASTVKNGAGAALFSRKVFLSDGD